MMEVNRRGKLQKILSKVGDLGFGRRVEIMLRWLDIQSGEKVLDCGCGEGFYSMVVSELYQNVNITAFDYNAELLKMAAGWTEKEKCIVFQNGNIEDGLPFTDDSFDKLIFTEVLEHLDNDKKALTEVFRVVKPGGVVGLTVPNRNYPFLWDPINWLREHMGLGHFNPKNTILGGVWSYDHKRLYSFDDIAALSQEAGFEIVEQVNLTHYCMPFNYLILRLGKIISMMIPSSSAKSAMEKFEWQEEHTPKQTLGTRLIFRALDIFKRVDSLNNNVMGDTSKSSVSVGLKLKKPD
jgi:SAM-dependent methyltransferase